MRNYERIDLYLDKLAEQIYPQPEDDGHTALAKESIDWVLEQTGKVFSVLDAGCGEAFCQPFFEDRAILYTGVNLGQDYDSAKAKGRKVFKEDFTFLSANDESYEMIYSRHSLEHSPVPLLTLMEWYRVAKKWVALVLPAPEYWRFAGRNHYFVLNHKQWENLFDVAGFNVRCKTLKRHQMYSPDKPDSLIEYWYLLERK